MEAGNLFCRCTRCANRCRVRLVVDARGVVTEARKQIPGRQMTYEECPNLSKGEGARVDDLRTARLIAR